MEFRTLLITLLFFVDSANANNMSTHTAERLDGSRITYYFSRKLEPSYSNTLLLVLQGSDCNSVLNVDSIFSDYQHVWPDADLLLIEKYGIDKSLSFSSDAERKDCPDQFIQNDNPNQRVEDIETVLEIVRKDDNYQNFIVLGGSEGAVIANLLASKVDYVSATISFNGGGRKFIDDVIHSIQLESKNSGQMKESIEGFRGFANHVIHNQPKGIVVSGHGYPWWSQMLSIDQLEVLKQVNSPLLILQGGIDASVSPSKVDEMISTLHESGKRNIKYQKYEDLNHGFNTIDGQSDRKKVVQDINKWLSSKLNLVNDVK